MTKEVVEFALPNIEAVCTQGLGVGLQRQRTDGWRLWA